MQGFLPYMPQPPPTSTSWPRLDLVTGEASPTTPSTRGINHPSIPVVGFPSSGYHYKKKSVSNLTTADSIRLTESPLAGGNLTPKDTMSSVPTTGKVHKAGFSLSSFIGGAPINTKRRDPFPRSSSGASGSDLNQGPSQEHCPAESGIQKKMETLEPPNTLGRLRKSSSAMSLKLKIPRFKNSKQKDSRDSDGGQFSASHWNHPDLPLSSNATYRLGRMAFQRNGSVDSMPRGSKDWIPSATNLPSRPTTSMTLRNEEGSAPATPRTTTDRSSVLNSRPNVEDNSVLLHDAVPSSSEYGDSETRRAHPTRSRDDISLNTRSGIGKYKSWRISRRASLSATTSLMSFSEFRALSTRQTNSSSLRLDQGPKDDPELPTRVDPGNSEKCPLPSSSPRLKYSTEDLLIPTSLIHTDMAFPLSYDTPFRHPQPPEQQPTSTSTSLAPSSDSRVSTPELTSVSSHCTTSSISSYPKKNAPTPAQITRWREDAEIIMTGLDDEFDGEVCLIRYEARQGWFGFWNKECITDVIDELRQLRSPRT